MNELFCCKAAEGLKARFDTTHQNFEVFHGALPQPDGSPTLLGGCSPWRCHTLATDSEGSNLAAAAAALVAFRIGPLGMLCDY